MWLHVKSICVNSLIISSNFILPSAPSQETNIYTSLLSANSDVYLGYLGWAAGSFDTSYGKASKVPQIWPDNIPNDMS
jgi:putative AlgH/UPF0301 family transcriptional regulator